MKVLLILFGFLLLWDIVSTKRLEEFAARNRVVLLQMKQNQDNILNRCAPRPEKDQANVPN